MRTRLTISVIILLILFVGAGIFWYQMFGGSYGDNSQSQNNVKNIANTPEEPIVRKDTDSYRIPEDFPSGIPIFPESNITETYNKIYSISGKLSQAVVVLESDKPIDEIKKYYESKLKAPDFIYEKSKPAQDTEERKTILFTTDEGMLFVVMEKAETGTKITLRFVNPKGNL